MKRLDTALFELSLAPSRSKAQELIAAGDVEVLIAGLWKAITQASYSVARASSETIRIKPSSNILKYVSRGGLKLEGALERLAIQPIGWRALDVGISTGGFADCLLQCGCREVIGVDVGHAQLAPKLAGDSRIKLFEGVNARDLHAHKAVHAALVGGVELCVVDVSFISLQLVFPSLAQLLPSGARLLALVKPQFEAGPSALGGDGVVRDPKVFKDVQTEILHALTKYGFSTEEHGYFPSCLKGQDGNQEFFVFSRRN